MLEDLTNEEKALAEKIIDNMRGERQMTTNTHVSSLSVTAIAKGTRFKKSVKRRLPKSLKQLDLLANLSVVSRYEYSKEDADALVKALEERVACVKVLFDRGLKAQEMRARKEFEISNPSIEEE